MYLSRYVRAFAISKSIYSLGIRDPDVNQDWQSLWQFGNLGVSVLSPSRFGVLVEFR